MAPENQHPADDGLTDPAHTPFVVPDVHPVPPAVAMPAPEPTEDELQSLMRGATPEAHEVPPENRAIETTRVAGEYVLPPPKAPKE